MRSLAAILRMPAKLLAEIGAHHIFLRSFRFEMKAIRPITLVGEALPISAAIEAEMVQIVKSVEICEADRESGVGFSTVELKFCCCQSVR
jgi:hypothetical protein